MQAMMPLAPRNMNGGEHSPKSVMGCPETFIDIPKGHAPNVDRHLEARGTQDGALRCRVRRTRAKNLLELSIEEGNVFVLSAVRHKKGWTISEQLGGSTSAKDCVAQVLTQDNGFTCVHGATGSELLHVRHSEAQPNSHTSAGINTMFVAMNVDADTPAGVLAAQAERATRERTSGTRDAALAILESRVPKWDAKTGSLVLPYAGRAKLASARNFQLVHRGGAAKQTVLLYGKLEEDDFALDFAHPLSMLQALAIVLTTWDW